MAGFGIAGGMQDEQDRISQRRVEFSARMAELIARNPDLDVQGLLNLINNAAGTDNTLRNIYTADTLSPYVARRDKARAEQDADRAYTLSEREYQKSERKRVSRLQTYNAMQAWLRENPGATQADAQNAFYQFSDGNSDPQLLQGFLSQARQRKELADKQEKERQLGLILQNRSAVESMVNDLIVSNGGDVNKAREQFTQQFGTDSPYGISADSLFTPQRGEQIATRRAIDVLTQMEKLAGPNGDISAYESMFANDLTGPVYDAYLTLVERRQGEKLRGYNSTLADVGAMTEAAKIAGINKSNQDAAFEGYVFQQLGMSAKQAEEMGIDIATARRNFNERHKLALDAQTKAEEQSNLAKRMEVETYWQSEFSLPMAVDMLRKGDRIGLAAKIMESATQRGATNFTQFDANKIIDSILSRTELVTRNAFESKAGAIDQDVSAKRADMVKKSQEAAKLMFGEKGAFDARGLKDPALNGLLYGLAEEYDFANPVTQAAVDQIITAWAAEGSGNTAVLIKAIRDNLKDAEDGEIASYLDDYRGQLEIREGRFGQDKPVTVDEFRTSFNQSLDEDLASIESKIAEIKGSDLNDPRQLAKAISDLERVKAGIGGIKSEVGTELAARQRNTDWLVLGQSAPPSLFNGLANALNSRITPYSNTVDQLLASFKEKEAQLKAVNTPASNGAGNTNLVPSKLPENIQSGYVAPPPAETDGSSPFIRGVQSVWNSITNTEPIYGGRIQQIANFHGGRASPLGGLRSQTPDMVPVHEAISDLLNDPANREYLARNAKFMDLIDPNSGNYNPKLFVDLWARAQNTNAAPPQE